MASHTAIYTAELKSPTLIYLHHESGLAGLLEQRPTGWVARPCQAGRRASTKRWADPENAALSMWGRGAAEAVRAAWHEALVRADPDARATLADQLRHAAQASRPGEGGGVSAQPTHGPWFVAKDHFWRVQTPGGARLVLIFTGGLSAEEREATVRVASAAPDLLACAEDFLRLLTYTVDDAAEAAGFAGDIEDRTRAAIAKARGEGAS